MHYNQMYVFEFLTYRMKMHGKASIERLPNKLSLEEVKQRLESTTQHLINETVHATPHAATTE